MDQKGDLSSHPNFALAELPLLVKGEECSRQPVQTSKEFRIGKAHTNNPPKQLMMDNKNHILPLS
jgi:hypothetical protein